MPDLKLASASPPPTTKHGENSVSARRLKKREIDRRCQRQARERTKSRIAYLEGLVDSLRQSDADERSAALMRRLADTEKERDALSQTLKDIQKALNVHEPEIKTEPSSDDHCFRDNDRDDTINAVPSPEPTKASDRPRPEPLQQSSSSSNESLGTNQLNQDLTLPSSATSSAEEVPKVCNDACECCAEARAAPGGAPKSLWRYANNTLLEPYSANSPIAPEEDLLAEDMPIRIVLEGWDAVEQQFGLPISWKILRGIDQTLFAQCPPTERLAILRTMHLLLLYHRDPTPERRAKLPPWFLARPSQSIPHSYAINYFVWPGLRERFIFQQHKYCSNLFWQLFSGSLEISWPYDFRDCFAQRWDTGVYQLTPMFQECIGDIGRWTMRTDLFSHFPDLRSDIPASSMTPRPVSNLLQMQLAQSTVPSAMQTVKASSNQDLGSHQPLQVWSPAAPWLGSSSMYMTATPTQPVMAAPWIS